MPEPEMWVGGTEDGLAMIYCSRERCMVPQGESLPRRFYYLEIELPLYATPKEIDRIWHQHRIEHSS